MDRSSTHDRELVVHPRFALAKETTTANTEVDKVHRIVVGFDGTPSSVAALHWAVGQAELTASTLDVITTWEWPNTAGLEMIATSDFDPQMNAQKIVDEAVASVRGIVDNIDIRSNVVAGSAESALVDASRGAELLVVGCRGRGELANLLLGSVSDYCVRHAHCPVLVVRGGE